MSWDVFSNDLMTYDSHTVCILGILVAGGWITRCWRDVKSVMRGIGGTTRFQAVSVPYSILDIVNVWGTYDSWIMIENVFNLIVRCRAATLSPSKLPKFPSAAIVIRGLYSSDVRSLGKSLPSGGRVEFLSAALFKCFNRKIREISWICRFHSLSGQPKHVWDISWYLMPWSQVPRALVKRWCGARCCFWSVESVKWFGTSWLRVTLIENCQVWIGNRN